MESPSLEELERRRALVERILGSQTLRRSQRLRDVLAYIAEATFRDPANLRESAIGCAVYGRPAGYNTNDDNIVRMGVSQLRRKLAEYFDGEGEDEPLRAAIPKGNYALVFTEAEPAQPAPAADADQLQAPHLARKLLAVAVTLAVGFGLGILARSTSPEAPHAEDAALDDFWSAVIDGDAPTLFVSEDVDFLAAATAAKRTPSLQAYADDRQGTLISSGGVQPAFTVPATTQLSLQIATRLISAAPHAFTGVRFVASRDISVQAFKDSTVILVGSPRASPWLNLFENKLNFQFEHDPARRVSAFRNRQALPGEDNSYAASPSDAVGGKVYSLVALMPNLAGNGRVLMLVGTRSEGTEAAAEAVTNPLVLAGILDELRDLDGSVPYFEALLESEVIGSAPATPRIVAVRRHKTSDQPSLASTFR